MKSQAFNPYLPSYEYVPDGEPHIFKNKDGEERLFIFGSHDGFNHDEFCLNDYVTWSAPLDDLSDFRYEGIIYKKTQDPSNKSGKSHMNAPDVCQGIDGRYYLYYQLHDKTFTSVAVSDYPEGPYEFYGYVKHPNGKKYGTKKGDSYNFDPGILVDNGHVYMYTGFAPNAEFPRIYQLMMKLGGMEFMGGTCVELESDMLTVKSKTYKLIPGAKEAMGSSFEGHGFFEASSPRKIGDKYYLVYSSELSHELCYAVSDNPTLGFKFGGTIISIGDIGLEGITTKSQARNYTGNTHGGLVQIDNQWYIFYHRQTNKKKCNLQGCAEKIYFDEAGHIAQVEMTSCGLNKSALVPAGEFEARIACNLFCNEDSFSYDINMKGDKSNHPYFTQSGEDRETNGDQYIANMKNGAVAGFKYFDFTTVRPSSISVEVKGNANGCLNVYSDEKCTNLLGAIEINVDNVDTYHKYNSCFTSPEAILPLFFRFEGDGYIDFYKFIL